MCKNIPRDFYRLNRKILSGFYLFVFFSISHSRFASAQVVSPHEAVTKVFFALLFVTGLILLFAWLARRSGFSSLVSANKMQTLSSLSLARREKAVLVKVGNKKLLLGVAPGRVSLLQEFTEEELLESSGQGNTQRRGAATEEAFSGDGDDSVDDSAVDFSRHFKNILAFGNKKHE